jgi:hypothetical protein
MKREILESLLSGEHEIDKQFRDAVRGHILSIDEIETLSKNPQRATFECNYMLPSLLGSLSNNGLTEVQILKNICLHLEKTITDLRDK